MLRNQDGVMKMITDNGLVSLFRSSVEYIDSRCFINMIGHLTSRKKKIVSFISTRKILDFISVWSILGRKVLKEGLEVQSTIKRSYQRRKDLPRGFKQSPCSHGTE
jgi:hypothetical protein